MNLCYIWAWCATTSSSPGLCFMFVSVKLSVLDMYPNRWYEVEIWIIMANPSMPEESESNVWNPQTEITGISGWSCLLNNRQQGLSRATSHSYQVANCCNHVQIVSVITKECFLPHSGNLIHKARINSWTERLVENFCWETNSSIDSILKSYFWRDVAKRSWNPWRQKAICSKSVVVASWHLICVIGSHSKFSFLSADSGLFFLPGSVSCDV